MLRADQGTHSLRFVHVNDVNQGLLRSAPDAFLASRVIVCEGATEVGFVRGLDLYRSAHGGPPLASFGVAIADGQGGKPAQVYEKALALAALGYPVLLVRDDDVPAPQPLDSEFRSAGHAIVTWSAGRAIEDELFASLPSATCLALIRYAYELHGDKTLDHLRNAWNGPVTFDEIWAAAEPVGLSPHHRQAIALAARLGSWFKRIAWMEGAALNIVAPAMASADPSLTQGANAIFAWAEHGGRI